MKRIRNIFVVSLALFAAPALLASAQDPETSTETSRERAAPAKKAPVKKAVKKKSKKIALKHASEYIFEKIDSIPAYKFDKKGNPIIKDSKAGKKSAKTAKGGNTPSKAGAASHARPKLKTTPPIDGGDQQQQNLGGE